MPASISSLTEWQPANGKRSIRLPTAAPSDPTYRPRSAKTDDAPVVTGVHGPNGDGRNGRYRPHHRQHCLVTNPQSNQTRTDLEPARRHCYTAPAGMDPVDLTQRSIPITMAERFPKQKKKQDLHSICPPGLSQKSSSKPLTTTPRNQQRRDAICTRGQTTGEWGAIWVLGQAELTPETTGKKLPIYFNPFSHEAISTSNQSTQQEITIGEGITAVYTSKNSWSISNGFYGYKTSSFTMGSGWQALFPNHHGSRRIRRCANNGRIPNQHAPGGITT